MIIKRKKEETIEIQGKESENENVSRKMLSKMLYANKGRSEYTKVRFR